MRFIRTLFVTLVTSYWLLVPFFAHAQIVPCGGPTQDPCTLAHFFTLLVRIYNLLLGLAAIVAILFIVLAGVRMALYHYFENPEQELTAAKYTLSRAIFGLVIVITAYLVTYTVLITLGVSEARIGEYFSGNVFGN